MTTNEFLRKRVVELTEENNRIKETNDRRDKILFAASNVLSGRDPHGVTNGDINGAIIIATSLVNEIYG